MQEECRQSGDEPTSAGGAAEHAGQVVESLLIHGGSPLSTCANAGGGRGWQGRARGFAIRADRGAGGATAAPSGRGHAASGAISRRTSTLRLEHAGSLHRAREIVEK